MSQKKVDAYKEQKANRKEILKKEKRMLMLEKVIGFAVCLVAAGWVLYSVYDKVTDTSGAEVVKVDTVIDTSALDDYTSGLHTDESEEAETVDTEEEAEAGETADADSEETTAEETDSEESEAETEETPEE